MVEHIHWLAVPVATVAAFLVYPVVNSVTFRV